MAHNESVHFEKLQKLCRTCGHLAFCREFERKRYKAHKCSDNGIKIFAFFGISIQNDSSHVEPDFMCHKCHKKMTKMISTNNLTAISNYREKYKAPLWTGFDPAADPATCNVCNWHACLLKGYPGARDYQKAHQQSDVTTPADPTGSSTQSPSSPPIPSPIPRSPHRIL